MPQYRRFYGTGMPIFITAVTHKRQPLLIKHISTLKFALNKVKISYPFNLNAYVILPDHFHLLISLSDFDDDFSKRIQLIKTHFTKKIQHKEKIWQNRFWEHIIRDDYDYNKHLDYIHFNPVKHGNASQVIDWKFSSFHAYMQKGFYDENWGSMIDEDKIDIEAGE